MDIRGLLTLRRGAHPSMRIAYAVNPDARLSWGGLPAPGRGLSSVRPDACHLMRDREVLAVIDVKHADRLIRRAPKYVPGFWPGAPPGEALSGQASRRCTTMRRR